LVCWWSLLASGNCSRQDVPRPLRQL